MPLHLWIPGSAATGEPSAWDEMAMSAMSADQPREFWPGSDPATPPVDEFGQSVPMRPEIGPWGASLYGSVQSMVLRSIATFMARTLSAKGSFLILILSAKGASAPRYQARQRQWCVESLHGQTWSLEGASYPRFRSQSGTAGGSRECNVALVALLAPVSNSLGPLATPIVH